MLEAEHNQALAGMKADRLSSERGRALDYYKGDVSRDIANEVGRSQVVSMDVLDTIEGLMPQLMEIFTGGDDVVTFNAVGPEDEDAATQETDYINHVFMQQNPGFMILYSMIKDALLSKVGIAKVWWEEVEKVEEETYYGLDDLSYQLLLSDPDIEVVAETTRPMVMSGGMPAPGTTYQ